MLLRTGIVYFERNLPKIYWDGISTYFCVQHTHIKQIGNFLYFIKYNNIHIFLVWKKKSFTTKAKVNATVIIWWRSFYQLTTSMSSYSFNHALTCFWLILALSSLYVCLIELGFLPLMFKFSEIGTNAFSAIDFAVYFFLLGNWWTISS